MSATEAEATLDTMKLQPPVSGSNSSKYLSESLEKVQVFQNRGVASGTEERIVEFMLDKGGYEQLMKTSVRQEMSKGVDAVKVNYEGISAKTQNLRNIGVPPSHWTDLTS